MYVRPRRGETVFHFRSRESPAKLIAGCDVVKVPLLPQNADAGVVPWPIGEQGSVSGVERMGLAADAVARFAVF